MKTLLISILLVSTWVWVFPRGRERDRKASARPLQTGVKAVARSVAFILSMAILMASVGCTSFRVGSVRVGQTKAARIAKAPSLPGKFVEGECLVFARSLHREFERAGISSKILAFRYESLSPIYGALDPEPSMASFKKPSVPARSHAVVAYDDDGRTYLMDNESWRPRWVKAASPTQMARQFGGMDVAVRGASYLSEPQAKALASETLRPAGLKLTRR
jgi:hypothetical protein